HGGTVPPAARPGRARAGGPPGGAPTAGGTGRSRRDARRLAAGQDARRGQLRVHDRFEPLELAAGLNRMVPLVVPVPGERPVVELAAGRRALERLRPAAGPAP